MTTKKKFPDIRFKGFVGEWEEKTLGDVFKTHPYKQYINEASGDGLYEIVQQGNNPILGYANGQPFKNFQDVVLFGDHTLSLYKPNAPFFVATDGIRILSGNDAMDGDFLYSLLVRYMPETQGYKRHFSILKSVFSWITDNENEQARIGGFFKTLDRLISLAREKHERTLNIKKAMLLRMFPQKGEKVPQLRFKGFKGEWAEKTLGELAIEVKRKANESTTAPVMMISAASGFINQSEKYSSDNAGSSLNNYTLLFKGELAYNHGYSKLRNYGSCFELTGEEARIPFVYHAFALPNDNSSFYSCYLNSGIFDRELKKRVSSTARMDGLLNISYGSYMSIEVLRPSNEEQIKIGEFFRQLDDLLSCYRRQLGKLQNIKAACLQGMFA